MKEPEPVDIVAFLLCVFLLFAIAVVIQNNPVSRDIGYEVIEERADGSPLYIKDTKTGTIYYINTDNERIKVVYFD